MADQARLYHGRGGDYSPFTPLLDRLISRRMKARGLSTTRDEPKALYACTAASQALSYAKGGDPANIYAVTPLRGAVVGYQELAGDMIIDLESFSADLKYAGRLDRWPVLMDCAGDVMLMEDYLARGRGREALTRLVDHYLAECPVIEFTVEDPEALATFIAKHPGEVWINGPAELSRPREMVEYLDLLYPVSDDAQVEQESEEEDLILSF